MAIFPDPVAAIVTGESAYRNEAGIEIHLLPVNFFSKLKPILDNQIASSATSVKNKETTLKFSIFIMIFGVFLLMGVVLGRILS